MLPIKNQIEIPYNEIDENIVPLVEVINRFDGLYTIGSCGGHQSPRPGQLPANQWSVLFKVDFQQSKVSPKNTISTDGWIALEFLVWLCHSTLLDDGVSIVPHSAPPFLNGVGSTLYFCLQAEGLAPERMVEILENHRAEYFVAGLGLPFIEEVI
jgi:hypothetical protein